MGNVELCGGPAQGVSNDLIVLGHIKNSQTRALLSILDACKIKYTFQKVDIP